MVNYFTHNIALKVQFLLRLFFVFTYFYLLIKYYNYSYNERFFFKRHFFHIVNNDSLPIYTSLSVGSLLFSMINYFHYDCDSFFFKIYFFLFICILFEWFFIVNKESLNGFHTKGVQLGILKGMVLFICSEVMFFFSIFWAFFHFKLNPSIELDCLFPPLGINIIKMNCLPLFNTVLLVYSGIFLMNSLNSLKQEESTYITYNYIFSNYDRSTLNLIITLILGSFFVVVQFYEYSESLFSFNDSCYGSVFFLLTGFHGFHVIIGLFFLLICLIRMRVSDNWTDHNKKLLKVKDKYRDLIVSIEDENTEGKVLKSNFYSKEYFSWKKLFLWMNYNNVNYLKSSNFDYRKYKNSIILSFLGFKRDSHIGFICASWYWHFVDAIWLVVVSVIYSDILLTIIQFLC